MIVPRRPDARSPGPRGPDAFSPTGGSCRRAALAAADIRPSCQQISSLTASGRSGRPVQPPWRHTRRHPGRARPYEGCLRPARPLGRRPPLRERSPHERRHERRNGVGPLRRQARHEQTLVAGRWHHGAAIPGSFRLEQLQHPLRTVRRPYRDDPPVSFAQCLRRTHTPRFFHAFRRSGPPCRGSETGRRRAPRGAARAKSRPVADDGIDQRTLVGRRYKRGPQQRAGALVLDVAASELATGVST